MADVQDEIGPIFSARNFRELVEGERPWTATEVAIVADLLRIPPGEMWPPASPGNKRGAS